VNVGTYVQTSNGIQFVVIADTTQPAYSAVLNAYVLPANSSSVDATVQAVIPGTAGNVQGNTISQILSLPGAPAPTGISTVRNASGTSNGIDEESDQACIARFQAEMAGRWATPLGVAAAVDGAQGGLTYQVGDMIDQNGLTTPNFFSVIFNVLGQNTAPASSVISLVTAAVQANRPLGMPFTVVGPVLLSANVSGLLTLLPGADPSAVVGNANAALSAYLNFIGLVNGVVTTAANASTSAQYSEIIVVLRGVPGVSNVTGVTLNGGTADVTAPFGTQIVSGNFTLSTQ
jgi:phage-related baseplate assembly protein